MLHSYSSAESMGELVAPKWNSWMQALTFYNTLMCRSGYSMASQNKMPSDGVKLYCHQIIFQ